MSPFKVMYGVAPDLSNLQVFGCSAYVFLPQEIRCNKLVPKSELMIHLGIEDGIKGFHFMCIHNNTIFYAPRALFNEDHFPKCKKTELKAVTHLPKPSKQVKSTPSIGAPPLLPFHPHDNLRWDWAPSAGPPAPVAAQPPPPPGPLGLQRGRPAFLHTPHGPASNPTQLLLGQTGFTPPHVIQLPWLSTKHVQGQSLPSLRFRRLSSPSDTTCYDPARDRRAIAQVKIACDIRDREADYLSSPRVDDRDEKGSRAETMVKVQNEN